MEDSQQSPAFCLTLDHLFGKFPTGVCLVRKDGSERIVYANPGFMNYYGCKSWEEFMALTGGTVLGLAASAEDYEPLAELTSDEQRQDRIGAYHHSFVLRSRDGRFYRSEVIVRSFSLPAMKDMWILTITDTSFYHTSANVVVKGVLDRGTFLDAVAQIAEQDVKNGVYGQKATVFFNISNFTLYNSTHGFREGDQLLGACANLLKKCFPHQLVGYFAADNFMVLANRDGLMDTIEKLAKEVDRMLDNPAIRLKAGICFPKYEYHKTEWHLSFDRAKTAAATIQEDATRCWAVYTDTMEKEIKDEAYVLAHFHRALAEGHVKVYFQPVVRTLNGKLCSMEALSRWEDPERGLLPPAMFVPVLERSKLIHLLDSYVIEEVAKHLSTLRKEGRPVVPVSVNLSRADFELMHPFDVVDNIVQRYHLPRSLIRIEVTESALVKDRERIQSEVDRFRHVGYECWLDDFGSAFSSLNVLHDFHFDELKIDMNFLRHFNDRSRKIIKSIILMSKILGIHTLTEGVETKEQLEFLRNAGCEKIQGYYYGKPMPYDELLAHIQEEGIEMETPLEEIAYEKLGLVNLLTESPVGLFTGGPEGPHMISVNRPFRAVLDSIGLTDENDLNQALVSADYPMQHRLRAFISRILKSRTEESMTYIENGNYLKLSCQILYGTPDFYVGKCSFYNLNPDEPHDETKRLDEILRNLILVYDGIFYFHTDTQRVEVIQAMHSSFRKGEFRPFQWVLDSYFRKFIKEEDYPRFRHFIRPEKIYETAEESGHAEATGLFRVREEDGSYRWKEFQCRLFSRVKTRGYLLCIKDTALERVPEQEATIKAMMKSFGYSTCRSMTQEEKDKIFFLDTLMTQTELKFFWKDKNRRFLGASKAFLKYYGVKLEDILGKTDEDLGWNVKEAPFIDAEKEVLSGHPVVRFHGETTVKGEIHPISASKYPIYEGNQVTGLIGFFHDISKMQNHQLKSITLSLTDPVTGLLGHRGMLMAGLQYEDSYRRQGEEYLGVYLYIPEFAEYCRIYGKAIHDPLLHALRKIVIALFPTGETATYLQDGRFLVFSKVKNAAHLDERIADVKKRIGTLKESAGFPVTLYVEAVTARSSEAKNFDAFLHLIMHRMELALKKREQTGEKGH